MNVYQVRHDGLLECDLADTYGDITDLWKHLVGNAAGLKGNHLLRSHNVKLVLHSFTALRFLLPCDIY